MTPWGPFYCRWPMVSLCMTFTSKNDETTSKLASKFKIFKSFIMFNHLLPFLPLLVSHVCWNFITNLSAERQLSQLICI